MSETNEKKSEGRSSFQASEMANRTTTLEENSSFAEMQEPPISELPSTDASTPLQTLKLYDQEGMPMLTKSKEEASVRMQVKSKKKTVEAANPDSLLEGWRTETIVRQAGTTAGKSDKYYVQISTGCRCRSMSEVKKYLQTGEKRRSRPKLPGSGKNEPQSAALQSVKTLTLNSPDLNSSQERRSSDLNPEPGYVNSERKANVKRKQHSAADGEKQGQQDSKNLNASKMSGLDNSGNAVKRRKKAHPSTEKALDYGLTSLFTPASQGRSHALEQYDKSLSKIDGSMLTGPENTASKPSETGSKAREGQCTEQQSMAPLVQQRPSRGRPRGSRNAKVKLGEMKRQLEELGRMVCKQFLGIAPSSSPGKSES